MSRFRLLAIFAALVATSGCTKLFQSDGTRESEVVREWLAQDLHRGRADSLIEPGAPLVMSDFNEPLTLGNLRRMGPDRLSGCSRSTLRRRGKTTVVASWSCPPGTDLAFRTVYFEMRNGRIASANYTEAYQAVKID